MGYLQTGVMVAGHLQKSVAGNSPVTLTTGDGGEWANGIIELTGALTGSIQVILPLTDGYAPWVYNNTSGAFTVTVIGKSGTGVVVPQGYVQRVRSDGTNFTPLGLAMNTAGALGALTMADGANVAVGTGTGTQIGTGTTQKLGFFGATPVAQQGATTDLRQLLINLGFLATGGASPLNLNGGAFTCGAANVTGLTTISDAQNVAVGTTTGTKIGTATTQKLGFFNQAPIVQPSAVGSATGYAAGATAVTFHSDDTYTGNVGATAYTLNGLVAALKNLGLVAA